MENRIIYYYQTFSSLVPLLNNSKYVSHIHLSSIHFGYNKNNTPYIHLNDYPPDNEKFNNVWHELNLAYKKGIKIILMVGGAGGAFTNLFDNFDVYYNLLYKTIKKYNIISGIDLDIEEYVDIKNVKMLINRIDQDFGKDFIISMAPCQFSLSSNGPGMGGFSYKNLINSKEGQRINYFNGQFYGCFDLESYNDVINNGYEPNKINIGMLSSDFNYNFKSALNIISNIKRKYPNFGGVYVWEYYKCPPNEDNPIEWAKEIYNTLNSKYIKFCNYLNYFVSPCLNLYRF